MPKFPITIREGPVTVKVYRSKRADGRTIYQVGWREGEQRKLKQRSDYDQAMDFAEELAEDLAAGRYDIPLSVREVEEYRSAKELAGNGSLVLAIEKLKRAEELIGPDLISVCESWAEQNAARSRDISVDQVVKRFIAAKNASGVDTHSSYGRTLPHFVRAFGSERINSLTPQVLGEWLATFKHPGSINSHRKRIKALFRWCRRQGILPLDVMTAAERTDPVLGARTEIGLITPAQLHACWKRVSKVMPEYLPAFALLAWCGLRRAEVHGQFWEDIDLVRRHVRVTKAKLNTPARRLVPVPACAVAELAKVPKRERNGAICHNLAVDRIRDIGRTAGIDLAKNGFRHSWISARVVLTGNIPQTALEAGNTPKVIHAHYRELMTKAEAKAWFSAP